MTVELWIVISPSSVSASYVSPLHSTRRVMDLIFKETHTRQSSRKPEGRLTTLTAVLNLFRESSKTLLTICWKKNIAYFAQ